MQSSPSFVWKDIKGAPYRKWLVEFGSALMKLKLEFWYDQFLGKPPGKSAPTYWHQDEGYWGRNLDDKGATCWIPLQDVDAETAACISSTAATRATCSAIIRSKAWPPIF